MSAFLRLHPGTSRPNGLRGAVVVDACNVRGIPTNQQTFARLFGFSTSHLPHPTTDFSSENNMNVQPDSQGCSMYNGGTPLFSKPGTLYKLTLTLTLTLTMLQSTRASDSAVNRQTSNFGRHCCSTVTNQLIKVMHIAKPTSTPHTLQRHEVTIRMNPPESDQP